MNSKQEKILGSKTAATKSQQSASQVRQKDEVSASSMKLSQDQEATLVG